MLDHILDKYCINNKNTNYEEGTGTAVYIPDNMTMVKDVIN